MTTLERNEDFQAACQRGPAHTETKHIDTPVRGIQDHASGVSESSVTDVIPRLPTEVLDNIFARVEPQDLFRLRRVSRLWKTYLTQQGFMKYMTCTMVGPRNRSLEYRARNRLALLSGRPCSTEIMSDGTSAWRGRGYCNGHLVASMQRRPNVLRIKNLYDRRGEWLEVQIDENDGYDYFLVEVTPHHLWAVTRDSFLYCWQITTLERVARVLIPEKCSNITATRESAVLRHHANPHFLLLYHLRDGQLSRHEFPESFMRSQEGYFSEAMEEDGHYYAVVHHSKTLITAKVTGGTITMLDNQDLSTLPNADDRNVVLVTHRKSLCVLPDIYSSTSDIYRVEKGKLYYCQTLNLEPFITEAPDRWMIFPELKRAYHLGSPFFRPGQFLLYCRSEDHCENVVDTVGDLITAGFKPPAVDYAVNLMGDTDFLIVQYSFGPFLIYRFFKEEEE